MTYDHTENKKLYCQATIETLKEQLAARDAVIVKLREALKDATIEIECTSGTDMSCDPKADCSNFYAALALPNDDSALQEALKQAKREGQAEMRERAASCISSNMDWIEDVIRALPIGENE